MASQNSKPNTHNNDPSILQLYVGIAWRLLAGSSQAEVAERKQKNMKIGEVSTQEKITAMYELCGMYFGVSETDSEECWRNSDTMYPVLTPPDLSSYDTLVPMVQKLSNMQFIAFMCMLLPEGELFDDIHTISKARAIYFATIPKLRDAILVASGKFSP